MYVDRSQLGFLPAAAMAAGPIMQAIPGIITSVTSIGKQTYTPLPPTQLQRPAGLPGWVIPAVGITVAAGLVGLLMYMRRRR